MPSPNLRVVGGTQGISQTRVDGSFTASSAPLFHDPDGGTWQKIPPGGTPPPSSPTNPPGGGGADMNTRIDRLEQHRSWLWTVLGLAFGAIGASFLFLLTQIDSRFDRVDEPLKIVRENVAAQTEILRGIDRRLERIENQMEQPSGNQPEASN